MQGRRQRNGGNGDLRSIRVRGQETPRTAQDPGTARRGWRPFGRYGCGVRRPAHSAGGRPAHSAGGRPAHSAGGRPAHSAGGRPAHSAGGRPAHSAERRPAHSAGGRPAHSAERRPVSRDRDPRTARGRVTEAGTRRDFIGGLCNFSPRRRYRSVRVLYLPEQRRDRLTRGDRKGPAQGVRDFGGRVDSQGPEHGRGDVVGADRVGGRIGADAVA
jgi:hypothetical protein